MRPPEHPSRIVGFALVALTLLALSARWVGLRTQLPHHPEPVAVIVWQAAAEELPRGKHYTASAYPSTFYPHLLSGALTSLPGHSYAQPATKGAPLEEHLAAASEPYLRARILIALLSVLMIPGTFLLARRWLEPTWSLFAAALVATSLLVLRYSAEARPHCAVASLSLLAVLGALRLLRTGTLSSYVLAAASAALAAASLYTGLFALPALFLAHFFAPVRSRATRWLGLGLSIAIVAVSIRLGYSFLFQAGGLAVDASHLGMAEQFLAWDRLNGSGFAYVIHGLWGYDPVLTGLACAGLALGLVSVLTHGHLFTASDARRAAWVAGSQPLCTFLFFGTLGDALPRFVIPLLPGAAVLGAAAMRWFSRRIARGVRGTRKELAIAGCAASLVLALPAYACGRLVWLNAQTDTEALAARWIEKNVAPEDKIFVNVSLSLPLFQDPAVLAEVPDWVIGPWERYLLDWPDSLGSPLRRVYRPLRPGFLLDKHIDRDEVLSRLDEVRPSWAVVSILPPEAVLADDTRNVVREIAGDPVLRIWPNDDGSTPLREVDYEAGFHQLTGVLSSRRHGPPIEIYRVGKLHVTR